MQLKKLKLKKNNWNSEFYKFDEVFAESASQKRIYETVAKPVVEVSGTMTTIMGWTIYRSVLCITESNKFYEFVCINVHKTSWYII